MCGIAGVLLFKANRKPAIERLRRMASVLNHRGPDEEGFYVSVPIGFAHKRLSIIDLTSGRQPMKTSDGQVCVVFNGEIYNYLELKLELEKKGYVFRTRSDTEVLLNLFVHYGLKAFPKLNGMFACAIWDARHRHLVLARDRFGKKPLFYYQNNNCFLFGSEIKALLAYGEIERKVNFAALDEYLTYGYTMDEHTIIEGIHRLPPAHLMVVHNGQTICRRYWKLNFQPSSNIPDESEVLERMGDLLQKAVKRRLMSDVPLGAFLSGGLDSSTIVALMAQLSGEPVRTFTIGFEESAYSEIEDAKIVASYLGTDHHEAVVRPSAVDIIPDLVRYLDEPFGDSSALPTYYVCRAAREHLTVALSGDGGDEVFAGYTRYRQLDRYRRMEKIPNWIRKIFLRPLVESLPFTFSGWNYLTAMTKLTAGSHPSVLGIYPYIKEQLYTQNLKLQLKNCNPTKHTEQLLSQSRHLDPISKYQYLDTLHYLPADILTKVDRMSMANSLEVRSPLLDFELVEYMATIPASLKLRDGISKVILKKFSSKILPSSTLNKRKQGFAIPKRLWFQKELHTFATDILLEPRTFSRGYFQPETLRQLFKHHSTGKRDYSDWIWCLIVLEMWFRIFIDQQYTT